MTERQKAMKAIAHVKSFSPETAGMMILPDGRWFFFDLNIKAVTWSNSIDVDFLVGLTEDLPGSVWYDLSAKWY